MEKVYQSNETENIQFDLYRWFYFKRQIIPDLCVSSKALLSVVGNVLRGTQPKTRVPKEVVKFETPEETVAKLAAQEKDIMSPEERAFEDLINKRQKTKKRDNEKNKV